MLDKESSWGEWTGFLESFSEKEKRFRTVRRYPNQFTRTNHAMVFYERYTADYPRIFIYLIIHFYFRSFFSGIYSYDFKLVFDIPF